MIFSHSLAVREDVIFFNCHGEGSCHVETTSFFALQMIGTSAMNTAQKIKIPIKDLFSKSDQISSFLWTWSHLLKKSLMENFIFCAMGKIKEEFFEMFQQFLFCPKQQNMKLQLQYWMKL